MFFQNAGHGVAECLARRAGQDGEMRLLSNLKTPDDRQCPLNVIRVGPIVHTKRLWRSAGSQPSRADQESLLRM